MRKYKIATIVVQNGKVANLLITNTETEGIAHAEYCLNNYGKEKGTTQIVSYKHHGDKLVEVICDLSDKIGTV